MRKKLILPVFDSTTLIKPTSIVLHWWQMPSWLVGIKYFIKRARSRGVSVQFAVMKDGTVYQLVSDPRMLCRHARCANNSSIGIEIQGLNARELDENTEQFNGVVRLVKQLSEEFAIGPDFSVETENERLRFYGVTSHKVVDTYCSEKRLFKKRDVHDVYLERVKRQLN